MMVTAIVLIHVEPGMVNEAAEKLAELPKVAEVYSVAGEWDLVAIARVNRNEDLAELVTTELGTVDGVEATETLVAFRAFSRHDLERMFSIGMEN